MIPDPVIKGQGLPGFRRVLPEQCFHGLIISAEMLHESGLVLFRWLPSVKPWLPFHLIGAVQAEYCPHINTPFPSFVDTITRAGERAYLFTHERILPERRRLLSQRLLFTLRGKTDTYGICSCSPLFIREI